jgi:hypothetical protein
MTKLHELVAVEPDLKTKGQRALSETSSLFATGQVRLAGQSRAYAPLQEDGERLPDEITELATTVKQELDRMATEYGSWIDVAVQKEISNGKTSADVVVNGKVILPNLPAPALLNLESKLASLREIYQAIPTLDPTEHWEYDTSQGCWVAQAHQTQRTKKVPRVMVKYEATKEHPAQTEMYTEDVPQGMWTTIKRSGAMSLTEKRELLTRLDTLIIAVKTARQRANDADAVLERYSGSIFQFIHVG